MLEFLQRGIQANNKYSSIDSPSLGITFRESFVDPSKGRAYDIRHRVLTITNRVEYGQRLQRIYLDAIHADIVVSHLFSRGGYIFQGFQMILMNI